MALGPSAGLDQRFGQAVFVGPFLGRHRLVVGVVLVVPSEQLVGPTVQFAGDDGPPFGVELAGDLGHALTVLPAAQPVLGLHPLPLAAPIVVGVTLDEPVESTPELEGRLAGSGREQLRFVRIQGGPRRCVGLGSGVGDGFAVLVGDGAVLEGALGLRQLTELGGGLGAAFGLAGPAVLSAVQPVGGVLGRVGRVLFEVGQGPEQAGFAPGGPGPHPFGQTESFVDLGAGELVGLLPEEGHGCVRIEHQYYSISPNQWVQAFVTEVFVLSSRSRVGGICDPTDGLRGECRGSGSGDEAVAIGGTLDPPAARAAEERRQEQALPVGKLAEHPGP